MGILQSDPLASQASRKTITQRWFPKTSWKGRSYSKVGRVPGTAAASIMYAPYCGEEIADGCEKQEPRTGRFYWQNDLRITLADWCLGERLGSAAEFV